MLASRRRLSLSVLVALIAVSPALAGGKATPPVVAGFARFHADGKADVAEGGQLLFSSLHCNRCHASTKTSGDVSMAGPILDGIGARVKHNYLKQFLADPHATKPGTTMPNLLAGLDENDKAAKVNALAHYLASTGTSAQLRPDRKAINPGQDLYSKVGCVACHGTRDGKGEQAKLFAASIPLGDLKAKYTLAGLKTFLENPHLARPAGRMPGLLSAKEAGDVANYLLQGSVAGLSANNMKYSYYEGSWQNLPDFAKEKAIKSGDASDFDLAVARRLNDCAIRFEGYLNIGAAGNYAFHTNSDDGSKLWINDKLVVNNDGIHPPQAKSGKIKLAKGMHKVVVGVFNGGGGFELSVEFEGPETTRQNLGPRIVMTADPIVPTPPTGVAGSDYFPVEPKLAAQGKALFGTLGCANCHQMQNEKSKLNASALANLKAEGGCLDAVPKKGIPHYGLSAMQQTALQAALKKPAAEVLSAKDTVAFTMKRLNCYACHERNAVGGVEDAVKPFFQATFKEWGDEASIPPSLTGVGAKLKPTYMKKVLEQGAHDRPYMHTRMPKFGPNATHLVALYESLDPQKKGPKVALEEPLTKIKAAGRQMVGQKVLGCTNCHNFGGVKTEGIQGIDMAIMTERLNKDWYHNYMLNPNKYRPGTRMPTSFPEGTSSLPKVLDGTATMQIEAIWVYLADGKAATPPIGLNKQSIPLIPINEAIIYRNFIQGAGPRAIGVGFPERAHLAFDANDIRLAMIWQGLFMDARRHWTGRGEGFEPPMGDNILHLPTGVSFYILGKDDEAWPTKTAKDLGYKFKGYRLTDDQRPTFMYTFNDIKIEDTPNAVEMKGNAVIRRTLAISTENPIDKLYYRAAVADKIEADKAGWFRINDWRMHIEAGAAPIIRKSAGKMELLVPVQFKGNNATIVQEYRW